MSAERGDGLLEALAMSIPGVLLPWVVRRFMLPAYEAGGMELPGLTLLWLRGYWLAWLLPLVVLLVWLATRDHGRRDRWAWRLATVGSVLICAISIVAAWLPVVSAGQAI